METNLSHLYLELRNYNEGQWENVIFYTKIYCICNFLTHEVHKSQYAMFLTVEAVLLFVGGNNDNLAVKLLPFAIFLLM